MIIKVVNSKIRYYKFYNLKLAVHLEVWGNSYENWPVLKFLEIRSRFIVKAFRLNSRTADSQEGSDGTLSPLQCLALQASFWPGSPRVGPLAGGASGSSVGEWGFDLIFLGTRETRRLELPLIRI